MKTDPNEPVLGNASGLHGMTKREEFALTILKALIGNPAVRPGVDNKSACSAAVQCADTLIEELNR